MYIKIFIHFSLSKRIIFETIRYIKKMVIDENRTRTNKATTYYSATKLLPPTQMIGSNLYHWYQKTMPCHLGYIWLCPWQDSNLQKLKPKYSMFTYFITRAYLRRDLNPHTFNKHRILSPTRLPFRHARKYKKSWKGSWTLAPYFADICNTTYAIQLDSMPDKGIEPLLST